MKEKKSFKGFLEWILFHPQVFSMLSATSYVMAFLFCSGLTFFFYKTDMTTPMIIFGIMTIVSIYNLWKRRYVFRAFKTRKKEEYLDLTVADTLNAVFNGKEEEKWV